LELEVHQIWCHETMSFFCHIGDIHDATCHLLRYGLCAGCFLPHCLWALHLCLFHKWNKPGSQDFVWHGSLSMATWE
jgi:hypothetical protein